MHKTVENRQREDNMSTNMPFKIYTEKLHVSSVPRHCHSRQSTTRKCGLPGTHTNEYKTHTTKNQLNFITVSVDNVLVGQGPKYTIN